MRRPSTGTLHARCEFYLGDGWFTDGPDGPVDYYNAWGFYYHIGWIHRMNPGCCARPWTMRCRCSRPTCCTC